MYGNSTEAALLRQASYLRQEAKKLLEEGADYAKISHKLTLANECRRSAGESIHIDDLIDPLHYFLLSQNQEK